MKPKKRVVGKTVSESLSDKELSTQFSTVRNCKKTKEIFK
jgi:hypothetical protein